jgi:cytochrome P450
VGLDCDVRTLLELPYLNGVVHESLRLHSTSGQSIRHAFADDVLPLSAPVNGHHSIVLRKGEVESNHYSINTDSPMFIGTEIVFNHMSMNCRPEIWGEDSMEFRPERWINMAAAAKDDTMPGWEGVANFGSGNRQCVGAGFAVMASASSCMTCLT